MCHSAGTGDTHAVAAWLDEGGGVDARCAGLDDETLLMVAAWLVVGFGLGLGL